MTDQHDEEDVQEVPAEAIEAPAGWLTVVGAVMDGRLEPHEGIARLQALQVECPPDAEWLQERIETIRWTYGLDVEAVIADPARDYWEKVLAVSEALLEERVMPAQAVQYLQRVGEQFPEQRTHVQRVIEDIRQSPLWQLVEGAKDSGVSAAGGDEGAT